MVSSGTFFFRPFLGELGSMRSESPRDSKAFIIFLSISSSESTGSFGRVDSAFGSVWVDAIGVANVIVDVVSVGSSMLSLVSYCSSFL